MKILENIELSIPLLLSELDIDQLTYIHFSYSVDIKDIEILTEETTLGAFRKALKSKGYQIPENLNRNSLISDIENMYKLDFINKNLLKYVYTSDAKDIPPVKDSVFIFSLETIAKYIFGKNLKSFTSILAKEQERDEIDLKNLEKALDGYCINKKITLNLIGMTLLLGVIDRYTTDKRVNLRENEERVILSLKQLIYNKFIYYNNLMVKKQNEDIEKKLSQQEKNSDKLQKQLDTQKNNTIKLRETVKNLTEEKKNLQKELANKHSTVNNDIIDKLLEANKDKDTQIQKLTSDIKNIKEKPTVMYKQMVDNLSNQLIDVKSQLKNKNEETKELKKSLEEIKSRNILTIIEEYIKENGINEKLYKILTPYLKVQEEQQPINTQPVVEQNSKCDKIGYCSIENNEFYIIFPNKHKELIKDIPENLYIGNNQFVLVGHDYKFKWVYQHKYEKMAGEYALYKFGTVKIDNNKFLLDSGNYNPRELIKNPHNLQLREEDFVAIDSNYNVICFYKRSPYNASSYFEAIKAKGHKMAFVLKVLPNGIIARDVETEEEYFKVLDTTDIKERYTLIFNEKDEITLMYRKYSFYTSSSLYNKTTCGTVEIVNDNIFIKKLTGEIAMIINIPSHITLKQGDVIYVDEFNMFLSIENNEIDLSKKNNKVNVKKSDKENIIDITDNLNLDKTVTIVGNISYENSYKLAMFKIGYKVNVVDGHDSWTKISPYLKNVDAIVVIGEYISHDNMWRIKENMVDKIPVLFAKYSGANRILEQLQTMQSDDISESAVGLS